METGLQLLMRDGAVRVAFHPRLSAEQYAELLQRVERAATKEELRRALQEAAKRWGNELVFDTEIV
jgi:hypothetical protein